ncbi:MAG: bifunctional folylpolyglutamate synthase/dihydrofolate synthase [Nitrospinota bacterium]
MNSSKKSSQALSYLASLEMFGVKLGLEAMQIFLDSIGSPQLAFRSILVAGTNGKGSTSAMIAEIAKNSGLKTGLYTSPHIHSVLERVQVNSQKISEERFCELVGFLRKKIESFKPGFHLTMFEFLTALAILYFKEEWVDIAVFEVGLGGRLDATNVVYPELSVLTEIDLDHTETLGNSIEAITREKCGIIRPGGVTLLTSQKKEVVDEVTAFCIKKGASLRRYGEEYRVQTRQFEKQRRLFFLTKKTATFPFELSVRGAHQYRNAATAIQAMHLFQGGTTLNESVQNALKSFRIEGRTESVKAASRHFVLDIAHNPGAAKSLAKTLTEEFTFKSLFLITGIMEDKDLESILRTLAPLADTTIVTRPDTDRAASVDQLAEVAEKFSKKIFCTKTVEEAVTESIRLSGPKDLIVITGSCHTVGEAGKLLRTLEREDEKA